MSSLFTPIVSHIHLSERIDTRHHPRDMIRDRYGIARLENTCARDWA